MPLFREADDLRGARRIPYPGLNASFYSARQTLIPFLGAGASLPSPASASPRQPDPALVDGVCASIGVTHSTARAIIESAISAALRVQNGSPAQGSVRQRLANSAWPPSAGELAEAFAQETSYDGPTPPLLEVASYYEYVFNRDPLRAFLSDIFNAQKTAMTSTHQAVAAAAKFYVETNRNDVQAADYLIVTTNYDGLIEIALDRLQAPYAVVTVPREDWNVDVRFHGVQSYLGYTDADYSRFLEKIRSVPPRDLSSLGKRSKPIVVLYKIHGDLHPPGVPQRPDSVIISDDDYVSYIRQDARIGMVPAVVSELMENRALLILGYRFADWNIRSLYLSVTAMRTAGEQKDWTISLSFGQQESAFFEARAINMVETTLDRFWQGIGLPPSPTPPPGAPL